MSKLINKNYSVNINVDEKGNIKVTPFTPTYSCGPGEWRYEYDHEM